MFAIPCDCSKLSLAYCEAPCHSKTRARKTSYRNHAYNYELFSAMFAKHRLKLRAETDQRENVAFSQMNCVGLDIKNFIWYFELAKRFIMQFRCMDHELSEGRKSMGGGNALGEKVWEVWSNAVIEMCMYRPFASIEASEKRRSGVTSVEAFVISIFRPLVLSRFTTMAKAIFIPHTKLRSDSKAKLFHSFGSDQS